MLYVSSAHVLYIFPVALISQKDNFIGPCFMELLLCVLEWIQKNNSISSHIVRSGLLLEYMKFHQRPSLIKESNVSIHNSLLTI